MGGKKKSLQNGDQKCKIFIINVNIKIPVKKNRNTNGPKIKCFYLSLNLLFYIDKTSIFRSSPTQNNTAEIKHTMPLN